MTNKGGTTMIHYFEGGEVGPDRYSKRKRWYACHYPGKVAFFGTRSAAEAWLADRVAKYGVRGERKIPTKGEPYTGVAFMG
jgi:hypothetical protein